MVVRNDCVEVSDRAVQPAKQGVAGDPVADGKFVEAHAGAKWADGALVDVRDRDETVELVVAGPPNCFGRILTLSSTMSSTYSEMVARRSGASDLQKQLDERVAVARNDSAGEGIDVNFPSAVAMRMKMPVRVLWSLEVLALRRVPA